MQLLSIPQLDAIQRSLKLLDVRLQHVQSAAKDDEKTKDDIGHIRKVHVEIRLGREVLEVNQKVPRQKNIVWCVSLSLEGAMEWSP